MEVLFKSISKLCFLAVGEKQQAQYCDNDLFVLRHQNEAENATNDNRSVLTVQEIINLYLKNAKQCYELLYNISKSYNFMMIE